MAQAQQHISEKAFKLIRMAEHPNGNSNEANVAAAKVFEHFRTEGVSLSAELARKAGRPIVVNHPPSILMKEKIQLAADVVDLRAKLARSQKKASLLSVKLDVAKNEIRDLCEASEQAKAKSDRDESAMKASNAEIAAMKAELESVRAQAAVDRCELAAERAKPAPISADDLAMLAKVARDQQAQIARLLVALEKAGVAPGAAPAPSTPVSTPVAPAAISKRSQGAHQAWVTRRAKAAAAAPVAPAPSAPASAPVAPTGISKRSQAANKAWVTRRAKAAAAASAVASVAPAPAAPLASSLFATHQARARKAWVTRRANSAAKMAQQPAAVTSSASPAPAANSSTYTVAKKGRLDTVRAHVLQTLRELPGEAVQAKFLASHLLETYPSRYDAKRIAHTKEGKRLVEDQLRVEIHAVREHHLVDDDGVIVKSEPFGTRTTYWFAAPSPTGATYSHAHAFNPDKSAEVKAWLADGGASGEWLFSKGRVWFENGNDLIVFKQMFGAEAYKTVGQLEQDEIENACPTRVDIPGAKHAEAFGWAEERFGRQKAFKRKERAIGAGKWLCRKRGTFWFTDINDAMLFKLACG
jgi:hypothetical protein